MAFNYLEAFPIPNHVLPARLLELLTPVGLTPKKYVEVACMEEFDQHGDQTEIIHLQMAVVPDDESFPIEILNEAGSGVVEFSTPIGDKYGCSMEFSPSISGYDFIVASWGNGSFNSFNLAEKVWMTLGLTPRCVGNDEQRLVYDDLVLPEIGVAEGETSSKYYWKLNRNVSWRMSNEYLRRYLWLRGARGVRVFYYEAQLEDISEIRSLMGGNEHINLKPSEGAEWYDLNIQENNGGLLLQLSASVESVTSELSSEQNANNIVWPGDEEVMTRELAKSSMGGPLVYLDDRFLIKYEQSAFYNSTPFIQGEICYCNPSYLGQWSFTGCQRVGRNLIRVSIRDLYKAKPDREILHARFFAIDPADMAHFDLNEEHIVAKVQRLLDALLHLGDNLNRLGASLGLNKSTLELVGFDKNELINNGWMSYPVLNRLAQVVPLDMTQQSFLARCKSLHEIWQIIPNGYLKKLLEFAGCPRESIKDLGSIKLLQSLLNIVNTLIQNDEMYDVFASKNEPEGWSDRNNDMAPLFINYDLRISDAHEAMEDCLKKLELLGFDTAYVNSGYGKALDFVMDGVINSFQTINKAMSKLMHNN